MVTLKVVAHITLCVTERGMASTRPRRCSPMLLPASLGRTQGPNGRSRTKAALAHSPHLPYTAGPRSGNHPRSRAFRDRARPANGAPGLTPITNRSLSVPSPKGVPGLSPIFETHHHPHDNRLRSCPSGSRRPMTPPLHVPRERRRYQHVLQPAPRRGLPLHVRSATSPHYGG
jgi:hypothetical protein